MPGSMPFNSPPQRPSASVLRSATVETKPDQKDGVEGVLQPLGLVEVLSNEMSHLARCRALVVLGDLAEPIKVGLRDAIDEILQRSESAQQVLDEATEDFRIQLVQEDAAGEEVLSLDRITTDRSPIIKLVDSTIFNAIQRRASDIHIETRESEGIIKYRIDGVLSNAMDPIDKKFQSPIISRINYHRLASL